MFVRVCLSCQREIVYKGKQAFERAETRKQECRSCFTKRNNPFRGKHFSEVSKAKLRASKIGKHPTLETRQKMSISHSGERNHFFGLRHTDVTKRMISEKSKERTQGSNNPFFGKKHSIETRKRMSESRAKGIAEGRIPNTNGYGSKSWYVSSKTGEHVYCDSLLEKFRMLQLDVDPDVVSWTKKHGIRIPYVTDKQRYYVPDFLITTSSGDQLLEEVKGRDLNAHAKHAALKTYCNENGLNHRWIDQTMLEQQGYRTFVENQ